MSDATNIFANTGVQITTEGRRNLGAVRHWVYRPLKSLYQSKYRSGQRKYKDLQPLLKASHMQLMLH